MSVKGKLRALFRKNFQIAIYLCSAFFNDSAIKLFAVRTQREQKQGSKIIFKRSSFVNKDRDCIGIGTRRTFYKIDMKRKSNFVSLYKRLYKLARIYEIRAISKDTNRIQCSLAVARRT